MAGRGISCIPSNASLYLLLLLILAFAFYEAVVQRSSSYDLTDYGAQLFDNQGNEIIHVTTILVGVENVGRIEMMAKSFLLFHRGTVHIHVLSQSTALGALSTMFQTWRIKRLQWSVYSMDEAHDSINFIPVDHPVGNMGFLRFFAHDILPLYVEKVIFMDWDALLIEDITVMHSFFQEMDKQGAFFAAGKNMYRRRGERAKLPNHNGGPNVGIVMLDLKRMRETHWDDLWREATVQFLNEFGPPTSTEQDIFTAMEYYHPTWGYRLPCEYNYQLGEYTDEKMCPQNDRYDGVKLLHWTGRAKWALNKARTQKFTRIYQCIDMMDWSDIIGEGNVKNNSPAKTLLYMKLGEKPNPESISLSVVTQFHDAFALFDRVSEWPGEVNLIVVGTNKERMQMRDYLIEKKLEIGSRISIHFVHNRTNLEAGQLSNYLRKIGADISRTDHLLMAFDINALDISLKTYEALKNDKNGFVVINSMDGLRDIGVKTMKKKAQRLIAERKTIKETAAILKTRVSNFTSAVPSRHFSKFNFKSRKYPDAEFCRRELLRRKAQFNM